MKVTFIIRNDYEACVAVQHLAGSASIQYRSVTIELTKEQIEKLKLGKTGESNGYIYCEKYDNCFIETEQPTEGE